MNIFYQKTQNAPPHENIKKFINLINPTPGTAIDLGCGAGRDTIYLLKNNWKVIAIDNQNTQNIIKEQLTPKELQRFKFILQDFQNLKLDPNNLIIANYSIPFCNKNYFTHFWSQITKSISHNRIFCRQLLRIKRLLGKNQ